jgi:hypothetical protein
MNTQLVESLAQIINNLTASEKQLLVNKTQLLKSNWEHPFYETATTQQWIKSFEEWANSHSSNTPILSDYAVSRESIYGE